MSAHSRTIQAACRRMLSAVARPVRQMLTPPPQPLRFVPHTIRAGFAEGLTILLPEHTEIAQIITEGRYESTILPVVSALVQNDSVCYDVGGHYGCYSLNLAKMVPQGQVHTFEPVAAHAERIRSSVELSGLSHVTVHQLALADNSGTAVMRVADAPGCDDSMAYLEDCGGVDSEAARVHYQKFTQQTVPVSTIDKLAESLPTPQFIKIDAEGAEAAIVAGGLQTIADARPRLLIETHGVHEALTCAELFHSIGYRGILIREQHTTMPVLWIAEDDDEAVEAVAAVLNHRPTIVFDRDSGKKP